MADDLGGVRPTARVPTTATKPRTPALLPPGGGAWVGHLMVDTAAFGNESHDELQVLAVIGAQSLALGRRGGGGPAPGRR